MATATFRDWLQQELKQQQISRRALAKRLAAHHPEGVNDSTVETYRRAIYKYLDPVKPACPTNGTRAAFAAALSVDPAEVPSSEDEEDEDDLMAPLMREVQRLQQRISELESKGVATA